MTQSDILIVDDEGDIRKLIQGILEDEGYKVRGAANSDEAYKAVKEKIPALLILDIWLQGSAHDGLEILKTLKAAHPHLPFIMISGHGTIETAVSAIKDGAYDFIEKPFKSDRLLMMARRALENARLLKENQALKKRTAPQSEALLGQSIAIQNIMQVIEKAAPTNSRILIKGEAGTGKDVVAKLVHAHSLRKDEPYLALNCANLRPDRLEIELFGAEAGINGDGDYTGILEQAQGGTLLLDEIADMPLETQGKIVRVLQEHKFHKIGGQKLIELDVRVIATTNKDLQKLIDKGDFREDFYYRLNVVQIEMPPLKARSEDIEALAGYFLYAMLRQLGLEEKALSKDVLSVMKKYSWPGNVRQLKNFIEWICIMHGVQARGNFGLEHLPPELSGGTGKGGAVESFDSAEHAYLDVPLRQAREEFEKKYLLDQVERFEGNISKTAEFIGMERSALHRKLKSLQINTDSVSNKGADQEIGQSETTKKRA